MEKDKEKVTPKVTNGKEEAVVDKKEEKENARESIVKLMAEVDTMDPTLAVAMGELQKDDEVVGEIHDDYLRKLFILAHYYHREEARNAIEMKYEPSKEEREKLDLVRHRAEDKAEILMNMFWFGTRELLNIWCIGGITIRDGYKVVKLKERGQHAILGRLLGGDIEIQ